MTVDSQTRVTLYEKWLAAQKSIDPLLYEALKSASERLLRELGRKAVGKVAGLVLEGGRVVPPGRKVEEVIVETIVRRGRPALHVKNGALSFEDPALAKIEDIAKPIVEQLRIAKPLVDKTIPLVGRIDVANYAGSLDYVGTGWLVDSNVLITNRHVASLIAEQEGSRFVFRAGRFGEGKVRVSLDYLHEAGNTATDVADVTGIIWIEPDARKADLALLQVRERSGTARGFIPLATTDAAPATFVATIGYPARASSDRIPDQAWMDEIYGGVYDVKRVAPGRIGPRSRGWTTHDCTTLGGNSGSVVIDAASGAAVALHFAGQYMIENYAVPASAIAAYLRDQPWRRMSPTPPRQEGSGVIHARPGSQSVTFPLTVTVTIGEPAGVGPAPAGGAAAPGIGAGDGGGDLLSVVRELRRSQAEPVLRIRPGYVVRDGKLTDTPCIVFAVTPSRLEEGRTGIPTSIRGFPVQVRPASIWDQLAPGMEDNVEATDEIEYNDEDRTGPGFSFDWVHEKMKVVAHVGPERSWEVLEKFLADTNTSLVSSIYEFHAAHIVRAIETQLDEEAAMRLVVAPQSRKLASRFRKWASAHDNFAHIFVPTGRGGLVSTSYHIKVTVRDGEHVWLSSGNWKDSSQPVIPKRNANDPRKVLQAGNREWHIVMHNKTIATRFANHIEADFAQSQKLGGEEESVPSQEWYVDVPEAFLESLDLEAPPARLLGIETLDEKVRVKPLLTPDRRGAVFSEAVIELIESATEEIVMQNQYIKITDETTGFLEKLVKALIKQHKAGVKVRIILRSGSGFLDDVTELKRRGLDVDNCCKRIGKTHTKGIVVDGQRVLVGSHNWSSVGVSLNRDASFIFDNTKIAQYFLKAFNTDWDRAPGFELESPGAGAIREDAVELTTEDAPPRPGYTRIPLAEFLEG